MSTARASNPDFVPSLRLLIEQERYSFTDIGFMFGVTCERVRQWCREHGIAHPDAGPGHTGLFCVRVWDDSLRRFVPVQKRTIRLRAEVELRGRRMAERDARRLRRRTEMMARIAQLRVELGRDPTLAEMATAVKGRPITNNAAGPVLASAWDSSRAPTANKYRAATAAIFAATGIRVRSPGYWGSPTRNETAAHLSADGS